MVAPVLAQHTYLPDETAAEIGDVLSFLAAHEDRHGARPVPSYALVGADEQDRIELPAAVHQMLRQIVEALQAGRAVTVSPRSKMLTTQQAADLLGISRPTVVRLMDSGELPGERPGTRRQLRLEDVLEYRAERRERQYEALMSTADDLEPEDDPQAVLDELKDARKAVARKRRAARERI